MIKAKIRLVPGPDLSAIEKRLPILRAKFRTALSQRDSIQEYVKELNGLRWELYHYTEFLNILLRCITLAGLVCVSGYYWQPDLMEWVFPMSTFILCGLIILGLRMRPMGISYMVDHMLEIYAPEALNDAG